ncbi:MAG: hypothetical protein KAY24_17185 [Candidatus Eisenbacteria sp.]|nr:hypothetical protein [Candidatus Eisenbacteria bacterium]
MRQEQDTNKTRETKNAGVVLFGAARHLRGYRHESVRAPMLKTLAAALVDFSGWDRRMPSSTLRPYALIEPIEAAG